MMSRGLCEGLIARMGDVAGIWKQGARSFSKLYNVLGFVSVARQPSFTSFVTQTRARIYPPLNYEEVRQYDFKIYYLAVRTKYEDDYEYVPEKISRSYVRIF